MDRYPPDGGAWHERTSQRQRYKSQPEESLLNEFVLSNRDLWIERYLPFLKREIDRLNGGQISRHYLRRARLNYREFCQSKNPAARFSTWVAIQTCCAWLATES